MIDNGLLNIFRMGFVPLIVLLKYRFFYAYYTEIQLLMWKQCALNGKSLNEAHLALDKPCEPLHCFDP